MNCIKACAEHSNEVNMDVWAYDENGWPSGFAGKRLYNRTLDISDFVFQGENIVEINFIISNCNLLGPHHLSSNEDKYAFLKLGCN